eukprot:3801431-Amphidinium_carterae.1
MRCATPLRLMLKMCEILKGFWEILKQRGDTVGTPLSLPPSGDCSCWGFFRELARRSYRSYLLRQRGRELWLSEELAGPDVEGDALQKVEDGDTVSLSTECLQEDLCSSLEDSWTEEVSSSDEEDFTWEDLGPTRSPLAFQARGSASKQEEWNFYCSLANHAKEVDEDLASYATPRLKALAERNSVGGEQRLGGGVQA